MKRGEIYFINDEPYSKHKRSEMTANHPAVIVSSDELNADESVRTVEVVYMTTSPQTNMPTHVPINSALKPSTLLCEQVSTVSKDRLSKIKLGQLTLKEIEAMDVALAFSVGLPPLSIHSDEAGSLKIAANTTHENAEPEHGETEKPTETAVNIAEAIIARVKAEAERDTYKQLYTDLLATITKGATA